jgi:hypothetical protein
MAVVNTPDEYVMATITDYAVKGFIVKAREY